MRPSIPTSSLRAVVFCGLLSLSSVSLEAALSYTGKFDAGPLMDETAHLTLTTSGFGATTSLEGVSLQLSDASAIGMGDQQTFTDSGGFTRSEFSAGFDSSGNLTAINVLFSYFNENFFTISFGIQDPSINNNSFILEVESGFDTISSADLIPVPEPGQAALAFGLLAIGFLAISRRAQV